MNSLLLDHCSNKTSRDMTIVDWSQSNHEEADAKLIALVKAAKTCLRINQLFFILHLVKLISSCFFVAYPFDGITVFIDRVPRKKERTTYDISSNDF